MKAKNTTNDPKFWKNSGNAFFRGHRYIAALRCFFRAIELDPGYIEAWNNLGYTYFTLGKIEEAGKCNKIVKELRQNKKQAVFPVAPLVKDTKTVSFPAGDATTVSHPVIEREAESLPVNNTKNASSSPLNTKTVSSSSVETKIVPTHIIDTKAASSPAADAKIQAKPSKPQGNYIKTDESTVNTPTKPTDFWDELLNEIFELK